MTVSSVVVRAVAGWSGAETEFPTGIQVLTKSQLVVSLVPDEGARLPLTMGLHYAVNLSPAGVATVLPLPAFPAMHGEVSFVRRTPMTQDYDPTATDTYDAAGHAAALDRSAMRVAELSQAVDDIAASSVVVAGGAASVPAGAVYVSDGAGKAVAGPTADEISQAEGWAGDAKQAAKAAADSALAAALFDPALYSTAAQIEAMLDDYVPTSRKVRTGTAFLLNGVAGTDAAPAEADLTADLVIGFNLAAKALAQSVWDDGVSDIVAPISPEQLKAVVDEAIAARPGLQSGTEVASTSGAVIDFTGIPSSAKRITVSFSNVSITGTPNLVVQLINSSGVAVTSGYLSSTYYGGSGYISSSNGFAFTTEAATSNVSGVMTLCKMSTGNWAEAHAGRLDNRSINGGGTVRGVGEVTGVRISANGYAFDAGSINVMWE